MTKRITKRAAFDLDELLDLDREGFNYLLAERTGEPTLTAELLSSINYRVVGVDHRTAHDGGAGSAIVVEVVVVEKDVA